MSADLDGLEPSLKNVIDQTTLKWVFVGGNIIQAKIKSFV